MAEHTHDHPHDHGCRDISHLMRGIRRFRERFYEQNRELMQRLVDKGQSPPALVISCSDSRVDPTLLSDAEPGQLFVVRSVASGVPPYGRERAFDGATAAIEYAVRDLKVAYSLGQDKVKYAQTRMESEGILVKRGKGYALPQATMPIKRRA